MQNTGRRKSLHSRNTAERKLLPVMTGIAVILVLLIVILARNTRIRNEQQSAEASVRASEEESRSIEASIAASVAESEAAVPKITLDECDDPGIRDLVIGYFDCRLAGDAESLYRLFSRDVELTGVDGEFAAKLSAQKSWVRSFDDIQIYLLPGENENEKLGIVTYRVNFRRVSTKAPGIMYFYAMKEEDGNWKLGENLLKEKRELIRDEFEEASVGMLIDDTRRRLKEALESDSDLALMYTSFRNGEIYSEYNLDPDREQQVDLFTNPEDSILLGE